jgi:hypothetical protein
MTNIPCSGPVFCALFGETGDCRSHWLDPRHASKLSFKVAGGCGMREVLMIYLGGVILLLAVSTMINDEEEVGLDHILIAGFGWPILTPLLAFRAWHSR